MGKDTKEYVIRELIKPKKDVNIGELNKFILHKEAFIRSATAQLIGKLNKRESYNSLINLMRDSDSSVVEASVYAAAETKDSRFLFPIVNLYNHSDERFDEKKQKQIKISILNALAEIKDPRAIDFLTSLEEEDNLQKIVDKCIASQDFSRRFAYAFAGANEMYEKSLEKKFRIPIKKTEDFFSLINFPELTEVVRQTEDTFGPLTYIVDEKGHLFIGANVEEHVYVAHGEKVLAAGQMTISKDSFEVLEIDNTSNGYFPARTTDKIICPLLDHLNIKNPGKFTYLHPRNGFFSDDFLSIFPFHPKFEKRIKKRKN